MNRRQFIASTAFAVTGTLSASGWALSQRRTTMTDNDIDAMNQRWESLLPADHGLNFSLEKVTLNADEWRARLDSDLAFTVLRKEGTERAGSHPYNVEKRAGVFACAGCSLPLFTSEMKYDSGTGWPSYFTHIPGHIATKRDFKLVWPRTEYHCARCEGHQGHVFDDGPEPTGKRFCNNGVALTFIPQTA
ncbi:MAG: peptide-methionine (R)-S-oxide reductase MsrB [Lysobacterales bacterium]